MSETPPAPKSFVSRGALLFEEVQIALLQSCWETLRDVRDATIKLCFLGVPCADLVGRKVSSSRAMSSSKWYRSACGGHIKKCL